MREKNKLNQKTELYKAIEIRMDDDIKTYILKYLKQIYLKEAKKFFKNHPRDEANLQKFFKLSEKKINAETEQLIAYIKKYQNHPELFLS